MVHRGGHARIRTAEPLSNEALTIRQLQRTDRDGWWTGVLRILGGEPRAEALPALLLIKYIIGSRIPHGHA